jgi:hypothetical protein
MRDVPCAIRCAVDRLVVQDDDLTISRQFHIEFNTIRALIGSLPEGRESIFRSKKFVTTMTQDDRDG